MTYNVFSGTLSPTQSISQSTRVIKSNPDRYATVYRRTISRSLTPYVTLHEATSMYCTSVYSGVTLRQSCKQHIDILAKQLSFIKRRRYRVIAEC